MKINWQRLLAVIFAAVPGFLLGGVVPGLLAHAVSGEHTSSTVIAILSFCSLAACIVILVIYSAKKRAPGFWFDFAVCGIAAGNLTVVVLCVIPMMKYLK